MKIDQIWNVTTRPGKQLGPKWAGQARGDLYIKWANWNELSAAELRTPFKKEKLSDLAELSWAANYWRGVGRNYFIETLKFK